MIDLTMMASAGLVNLALSGNGSVLQRELAEKNIVAQYPLKGDGTPSAFSDGVGGPNPTREDLFVTCNGRKESLANGGVKLPDGSKWAMYHPTCYRDHFIIEYADGTFERWDVGWDEGNNMPYLVEIVNGAAQKAAVQNFPAPFPHTLGDSTEEESGNNQNDSEQITEEESGNDGNDNQNNSEQSTEEESDNDGNDNQNDSEQITEEESDGGNSNSSSGGGSDIGLAVGGVAVVGIAVYLLSGGTAADVSFAPDYGLHYTEDGGTEYFYGAKWEYEKANWRADWTAMRARKSESWRYASGVEWTAGVWRAAFGGENTGDKTAMDLSLAAERRAGGWMLKSAANANARFDEFGGEFAHYFSAAASRRVSEWEISVSAAARDLDDNPALRADMIFTREF